MEKFYTDVVFSLNCEQGCSIISLKETTVNPDNVLSAGPAAAPIAGAVVGGLMQGSGGRQQQSVTSSAPWSAQIPHLQRIFGNAAEAFRVGREPDPLRLEGLSGLEQQARAGLENIYPGFQSVRDTAAGEYLPGGSKSSLFDQQFRSAANRLIPGVQSTFGRAGRGKGGLVKLSTQQVLADALGDQIAKERQRQLQAAVQLPGMQASLYAPYEQLMGIASEKERLKYDEPWERMAKYKAMIDGSYGGTSSTPYYMPGTMQGLLGGALGGARLGSELYGAFGNK